MMDNKSTPGALKDSAKVRAAILIGGAVLFVALPAVAIVYVAGIRSKSPAVRNAARRFHHAAGNRLQMRSAGTPGRYASVIRHQGRTTGRTYQTPVWAVPTEDGFVIAIVYGPGTDWLKNVLAKGSAHLVTGGQTYEVDRPEVIPIDAALASFEPREQLLLRRIGVTDVLRVHRVAPLGVDDQRDEVATGAQ